MNLQSMPPPETKLNDLIDGTVKPMDEWVRNEIYRLQHKIEPRHFRDYSGLVLMFDDPSQFHFLNGNLAPPNPEPTAPVWLCKAFIELMRYRDKLPPDTGHPPIRLLQEFENLQQDIQEGKVIHVNEFRYRLTQILLGQIRLAEYLVQIWKLLCDWVTRSPIHNHQNALCWIDLTISAYIAAKKIY